MEEKIKKIKVIIMDVDGVLTDGRIIYTNSGDELKFFDVTDGLGVSILSECDINTAIITAKGSKVVDMRAEAMKVTFVYKNVSNKLEAYKEILKRTNTKEEQVCYIGDDIIDIAVLKRVGFAVAVANASEEVKNNCHYITKKHGGRGAVREVVELILKTQGRWNAIIDTYLHQK